MIEPSPLCRTDPVALGVAFELASLPSIHPQSHDIPMDVILTEQQSTTRASH
jgi:5-formyltetrahydrofolate cyclo-ligase